MERASSPSVSARVTAAVTIRSRVRAGFGPRAGRSWVCQSSSMLRWVPAAFAGVPPGVSLPLPLPFSLVAMGSG